MDHPVTAHRRSAPAGPTRGGVGREITRQIWPRARGAARGRNRCRHTLLTAPNSASHRRIAFSRIASKTGVRSPGEELMTCNTSDVAVCWSSASRVSVISRAFSIAITACAAKFCNRAICLSVNGRTSWR